MSGETNLEHLLRQQESLRQVIESISSELELRPLLTRIVRHACDLIGADNGAVGLVDESRQLVRTEAVYQMPAGEIGAEMPLEVGLAGQVLLTRQPIILNRYSDIGQTTLAGLDEFAVIGLPILWGSRMIGFFGIGAAPPRQFNEQDVETLTVFARHTAIAIENARLFDAEKRRATRIATINHIGQLITSGLNLDQLLQEAVETICEDLRLDSLGLALIDPENPEMLILLRAVGAYAPVIPPDYRQSIHVGLCGLAARTRQSVLLNDVSRNPDYISMPGVSDIYAELVVPVVIGERLLGVLNFESRQPIMSEDVADLEIVAHQLGVAIENARLFSEIENTLNQTQLLYQTSQRISTAMDVDEVIQAYLEQVAARSRYACTVVLYELDEQGQRTAVIVRGQWTHQTGLIHLQERIPYARDALDPPLDAGQTITIADVATDSRVPAGLRQMQMEAGRPALAFIPLMVREQRIGLVILSDTVAHPWEPADLHPYQTTAAQLATAIDSRRQYYLLSERGRQIAVLKERQRLARDLHDSVTQLIFSMTLIAQSIAPAWRRDQAEGERRVNRLLELSHAALAEMRALLAELRPPDLQPLTPTPQSPTPTPGIVQVQQDGLVAALQNHLANLARDGLPVTLNAAEYVRQPFEYEEALYRIAQEALNNVVKHARAQRADLILKADGASIQLQIIDNGVGFTANATAGPPPNPHQGGLGLTSMRERAEALGGTIQLTATPGIGARVAVTIPRKD